MIVQFAANEKISTVSCTDCRERRVKCDRQLPACLRCTKRKVPCYYNFAGRKKQRKSHFIDTLPQYNLNQIKQNEIVQAHRDLHDHQLPSPRNDMKITKRRLIQFPPTPKLNGSLLINTDLTPFGKKLLLALVNSDKKKMEDLLALPQGAPPIDFLLGKSNSRSPLSAITNPNSSSFFLKLQGRLAESNLEGSPLTKLMQSESFQNLFDPQFWDELIDIYINRVHIFYPIFDLTEFQKHRSKASNCLLASMYYIGYLCRPNQDPFLCQYLQQYALKQISKMYYGDRISLMYAMMIMANSIGYSNNISSCRFFLSQASRIAYGMGLHRVEPKSMQHRRMYRANLWNIFTCFDILGSSFFNTDPFIPEVYFQNTDYSPNCIASGITNKNGYIPLNLGFLHNFDIPQGVVPNQNMFWYQKSSPSSSPDGSKEEEDNSIIDQIQPKCLYLFRYIIEKYLLPIAYHINKLSSPHAQTEYPTSEELSEHIRVVNISLDSGYIFGLTHFTNMSRRYTEPTAHSIIMPVVWGFVLMLKTFSIIVNSQRPISNSSQFSPLPPYQMAKLISASHQLAHITALYPPNFVSFRYIYIIRAATICFQEYAYLPLSAQPKMRESLKTIYQQIELSSNNYAPFRDLLPKLRDISLKLGFDITS